MEYHIDDEILCLMLQLVSVTMQNCANICRGNCAEICRRRMHEADISVIIYNEKTNIIFL